MSEELITQNFAGWMRSATTDEDDGRLETLWTACVEASDSLAGRELDAVLAAHGVLRDEIRGWLGDALRSAEEGFVAEGKDQLLTLLAGAAVARRIVMSEGDDAVLCALGVCSAAFSGFGSVIPDLPGLAPTRLEEMGSLARARRDVEASFAVKVPQQRKEPAEGEPPLGIADALSDAYAAGQATKKLAQALSMSFTALVDRQAALDEEVEMLWWVISGNDQSGTAWSDRSGLGRAVAGAAELAHRTAIIPGPRSAAALLKRLLGKEAPKTKTLAEFAGEASSQAIPSLTGQDHPLLPVASAVGYVDRFATEEDGDTWAKAMQNSLGINPKMKHTLASGSLQLYRELQMINLQVE